MTARPDGSDAPTVDTAVASPIDPLAIERLRELDPGGSLGTLRRVLEAYQQSLRRHLDDIGAAHAGHESEHLARAVHTMKSSSAAVGALVFSQRCADVEHLLRSGHGWPDGLQVEALIHEGRRVLSAVGAMLSA